MSGGRSGPFQLGTPRRFRYRLKASASIHGSESVELDEDQSVDTYEADDAAVGVAGLLLPPSPLTHTQDYFPLYSIGGLQGKEAFCQARMHLNMREGAAVYASTKDGQSSLPSPRRAASAWRP